MRLLVTGGAGYIGSVVSAMLVDAGHDVTILDDLSRGHRSALPDRAEHVHVDLQDREATLRALAHADGYDGVMHFAALALVGESVEHPERYWRQNVGGTLNLLDAMRGTGVRRLVFSSTCATYGQPDDVPISERTPTAPTNPYGASKLAADRMISDECAAHGLGAVSLRYFNVAGARGAQGEDHDPETHIVPNVLRAALGKLPHVEVYGTDYPTPDGTAIRDYIHVEDLGRAHILALEAAQTFEHRIYNLGNGEGFSVNQVVEAGRQVTGRVIEAIEAPRRPGDPPVLVAASDRIQQELGWTPSKPELSTMIADAWEFAQAHPDGYGD
jgi:UDP-glucose 4-epimerase